MSGRFNQAKQSDLEDDMSSLSLLGQWAQFYVRDLQWKVFAAYSRGKDPFPPLSPHSFYSGTDDEHKILDWWTGTPTLNIGVQTGRKTSDPNSGSGIVILDLDIKNGGSPLERLHDLFGDEYSQYLKTPIAKTGSGGYHLYYHIPSDKTVASTTEFRGLAGVDIRGEGGFVIAPPSIHPTGVPYRWLRSLVPEVLWESEPPEDYWVFQDVPEALYTNTHGKPKYHLEDMRKIGSGERNTKLAWLGSLLRSAGIAEPTIVETLYQHNLAVCDPPLDRTEVEGIAKGVGGYLPYDQRRIGQTHNRNLEPYLGRTSDTDHAEVLSFLNPGTLKYNHRLGKWNIWSGSVWNVDESSSIVNKVIEMAREMNFASQSIEDEDRRREAVKNAKSLENATKIESTLKIAKSLPGIATTGDEWDRDPFLFGIANGVVDLRTGRMSPGNPDDLISRSSPVVFNAEASCPRWRQFLSEIFPGRTDVVQFVQKAAGYSMTGNTTEQVLFLLIGKGSNGKSVFLDTLRHIAGSYGYSAPFSTFQRQYGSASPTNDLAALFGRRYVMASEVNEGASLDESRLKSLTGGDPITARFLHQEFFTFKPEGKIFLGVNHAPKVHDDSTGFWRRVRQIDFPVSFLGDKADRSLSQTLIEEAPGILNWVIEGAMTWFTEGLKPPETVVQATETYRNDSDPLFDFRKEVLIVDPEATIRCDKVFTAYLRWADAHGLKPYEKMSLERFISRVSMTYDRTADADGKRCFKGIRLTEQSSIVSQVEGITIKIR
jgi:putative DNA primase/helicase